MSLPPENDAYNRRLSLLRDRTLVNVLNSTVARLSEVLALNRTQEGHGRNQTATIIRKGQPPSPPAPDALNSGGNPGILG